MTIAASCRFTAMTLTTHPPDAADLESMAAALNQYAERQRELLERLAEGQQALQKSEQMLRMFIEHMPAGIAQFDREMRYIAASRRWLEAYGLAGQEIIGRCHYDLIPDLPEKWKDAHRRSLAGETVSCEADPFALANGSTGWVKWKTLPWFDADGSIGGILIAAEEITQHKQAVDEKLHTLALLDTLLQTAPVGFAFLDTDLRFLRINDRLAEINGLAANEHLGRCALELFPKFAHFVEDVTRRIIATGEPVLDYEMTGETFSAPGVIRSWNESWYPVRNETGNNLLGFGLVVEETTERKQAMERLRQSREDLEQAQAVGQIGSWRLNVTNDHLECSNEIYRIYEIAEPDCVTTAHFWGVVHPDDLAMVRTKWEAALNGDSYEVVHRVIIGGRIKWLRSKAYLDHNLAGASTAVGVTQDITTLKQSEEEIRQLNQQLESRVASRTAQLRNVVASLEQEITNRQQLERQILEISEVEQARFGQDLHDGISQELVGVAMTTEVLAKQLRKIDSPLADTAGAIAAQIRHSIESARTLAKGLYPIELDDYGLLLALRDMVARKRYWSGLDIRIGRADEPTGLSKAVEIHVFRIIKECVVNAIKHGKPTYVTIDSRAEEGFHVFTVTDDGTGFDCHSITKGMGLRLIDYRLNMIGGSIAYETPEHGGCRVVCKIPVPSADHTPA